ncbi:MAG: MFS transporter [Chloroflexi bacterium]|nr:MFS transporter [Chloroflexota bacterium]
MQLTYQLKTLVRETFKPRTSLESQNAWNLYGDIAWFGILSGIANSFLSVFAIRAGGSDMHVGLLSALPALISIFASIPGSRIVESQKEPLTPTLISGGLNRLGYLSIALIPVFFAANRADVIVAMVALLTVPGAIANVAFTTMFAQAVAPDKRAHVVSVRNVWIGITSTLAAFLGGKLLDNILFPINYQILFVIAFAGSMMSLYYLTRIRLPQKSTPTKAHADEAPRNLRSFVEMFRATPAYAKFTVFAFIFYWGMAFPIPLYSIYWVRVINASDGWVGLLNMVGSATTIIFYPLWGRLTMRRGTHYAIVLSTFGMALYPLVTALSPRVEWLILVQFLGGVVSSGFGLTFFNRLLEVSPEKHRASHIAAYNTLVNIAAFIAPLISTALTDVFGIHAILIVGGVMRFIGSVLFWRQKTETNA